MGIVVIPKQILVVQCGHLAQPKAFWGTTNDGTHPPDLWIENFPSKGRIMMSQGVILVACWNCRENLSDIAKELPISD